MICNLQTYIYPVAVATCFLVVLLLNVNKVGGEQLAVINDETNNSNNEEFLVPSIEWVDVNRHYVYVNILVDYFESDSFDLIFSENRVDFTFLAMPYNAFTDAEPKYHKLQLHLWGKILPECSKYSYDKLELKDLKLELCKKEKQISWPMLEREVNRTDMNDNGIEAEGKLLLSSTPHLEYKHLEIISPQSNDLIHVNKINLIIKTTLHESLDEKVFLTFLNKKYPVSVDWHTETVKDSLEKLGLTEFWASDFTKQNALTNMSRSGKRTANIFVDNVPNGKHRLAVIIQSINGMNYESTIDVTVKKKIVSLQIVPSKMERNDNTNDTIAVANTIDRVRRLMGGFTLNH